MMDADVFIVGQGMTGLMAAYRLSHAGLSVVLVDKASQSGGLNADLSLAHTRIEAIYHHCFSGDRHLVNLSEELGLGPYLHWYTPSNGLVSGGRLYPFTSPLDLLSFKPISFIDRIRTGLTVLASKRVTAWQALEKKTATDYLIEKSGPTAYEKLWRPLLEAKFGDHADRVSAVWIWNKFKLRGSSRDKGLKEEKLGYMDGGFGRITDAIVGELKKKAVSLLFDQTVLSIQQINNPSSPHRYEIKTDKDSYRARHVIGAVPAPVFKEITRTLPLAAYKTKLDEAVYKANICMLLAFAQPVSPYYWTTICDRLPFVVMVEQTNLVDHKPYGHHLLYLSQYLDEKDEIWLADDATIKKRFEDGLFSIFPAAKSFYQGVVSFRRSPYAQPVIPLDYACRMATIDTPLAGLYLAGMSQIYPEDRGLNYAVRLGQDVADRLLAKDE